MSKDVNSIDEIFSRATKFDVEQATLGVYLDEAEAKQALYDLLVSCLPEERKSNDETENYAYNLCCHHTAEAINRIFGKDK